MELRTTRIFERFSTTVSKNKQRYAESDPTQADLHALGTSWVELANIELPISFSMSYLVCSEHKQH